MALTTSAFWMPTFLVPREEKNNWHYINQSNKSNKKGLIKTITFPEGKNTELSCLPNIMTFTLQILVGCFVHYVGSIIK